MGQTITDLDIDIEEKNNRTSFSENEMGIAGNKVVEEMNKLNLNKISKR